MPFREELCFNICLIIISERTGALVQRWQEFGHSEGQAPGSCVAAIHRQPFPAPRYSLISDVPGVASAVQNQFLHLCYDHNYPRCAGLIGAIIHHLGVRSATFELSAPFSHTLHSHYVITVQKHVSPTKPDHIQISQEQFPNVLPLHIN